MTDHHDVAFLPYVLEASRDAEGVPRLLVLPGIEITCSDSVQCLAIFDPTTTTAEWARLLHNLRNVVPAGDKEPHTSQTEHCGLTLTELFDAVEVDTVLRDCVLLIPHFGRETDHKTLNSPGHAPRAKELPFDGVYIECQYSELDVVTVAKIQGRIEEWGTRRRAILATGDNRFGDWRRLGLHECWIKLGENSVEAIRQAFLADEARIAYGPPERPTERVVEIEVKSKLTGDVPVRISFNDGYTALIGGRGSGKSSILEYLRFGLGRAERDFIGEDAPGRRPRDREVKLIEDTLKGGWVKVVLERDTVLETWTRHGDNPEDISVEQDGRDPEPLNILAARERFRARAFHQKELSTTMVDPVVAADNITGIAAAEVIEEKRRNELGIANSKRSVTTALQDAAAHWQAELEHLQAQSKVEDLRLRRAALTERMSQGGVTPEDVKTLAEAPKWDRAVNFIDAVERQVAADRERVKSLVETALGVEAGRFAEAMEFAHVQELAEKVAEARTAVGAALEPVLDLLGRLDSARSEMKRKFGLEHESFLVLYEQAKARQADHRALIVENEKLGTQLQVASVEQDRAAAAYAATLPALNRFATARGELVRLVGERHALLKRASDQVVEKSGGVLKARPKRDRKPIDCVQALCGLLEGSHFRNPEVHCDEWVGKAYEDGAIGWTAVCDTLVSIYKGKILAGSPVEPGAEASATIKDAFFGGRVEMTPNQINRAYAKLSDQTLGLVLAATPKDTINLTYVSNGQDIRFEEASPGQQASALLRLLLRQEAGTLIVDQPEDDLDNRVMMEIVELIRISKSNRQLIFATHNPNLVVNGDADKVITMTATVPEDRAGSDVPKVRVEVDGAIETPSIRQVITHIMEGGAKAFQLRARKYGRETIMVGS
ncbi:AAA family ATPase [Roseomonas terrae]|uniref:AAA family ATPase n=1 Tax=Neoroseomonas terrae TaxID=424799 RepID=A0ABS5ECI5_9PROT|nr:AAA family ATPase [Neoroseomonas terrae]